MKIVQYNSTDHEMLIDEWLLARDMDLEMSANLPGLGFVAVYKNEEVAAGFLRFVEGGYGQIDSVITNPKAHASVRNKALDALTSALIAQAKEIELKGLFATTADANTLVRSKNFGFRELSKLTVIALDLEEKRGN